MSNALFYLNSAQFRSKEMPLVEWGSLLASGFLFETGVEALRLKNEVGELILLPFQGQQVWSATFHGRNLTMKSMFDAPHPTRNYLETYGGFNLHCGFTAMGVPAAGDSHPLHGELPNAPYAKAWVLTGEDEKGKFIGLSGEYQHTVAFSFNYVARPLVKLYAGSSIFTIAMEITNLKQSPMEYMYMAHVNFRPVDNGRLVYSAEATPKHVRVRRSIPSHVRPGPGFVEYLDELAQHPEKHHVLAPGMPFDPEVVFFIDYETDADGWAHSMQIHPDGTADYIRHKPAELEKGVRWICRTPDQDALGLILPSTAEPEGFGAEKAKGNVKVLPGGATYRCTFDCGMLAGGEVGEMEGRIGEIVRGDR